MPPGAANTAGTTIQTAELDDDSVTYAKIQNVSATDKVLGRSTSGAGDIEEIACTAAGRAILDDADAAAQRTTLGLGNVDNTSDANKPVSTATQTALDAKISNGANVTVGTDVAAQISVDGGTNTISLVSDNLTLNGLIVSVGTNGSGGTGFRALVVPNEE